MIERYSLPLAEPLVTAREEIERREGYVVRIEHHDVTGVGEAAPLPGWTESLSDCERALTDALDVDEGDPQRTLLELDADAVPAARHGVATALLDADARADGTPLYRWLGGVRCGSVPVNATVGDGETAETVERACEAVDRGFDCLKVKVGARPVDADLDRVAAVREAVGDDVTLRVDANGSWERSAAERAFDGLTEHDVAYVEQPLPPEDLSGHADLPGPAGVALDESLVTHSFSDVLDASPEYVVLKPMVLGGPGTAHTLALRARETGIEPIVTTTIDGVIARTAAVHVAAAIPNVEPCGLATAALLADDLAPAPASVSDGRFSVPQDPGLGIDPAEVKP